MLAHILTAVGAGMAFTGGVPSLFWLFAALRGAEGTSTLYGGALAVIAFGGVGVGLLTYGLLA